MPEPLKEAYGPQGDSAHHLGLAALESELRDLSGAPADRGRLVLIVRRLPDGNREAPERVRLTPGEGVPGDRWARLTPDEPDEQLTVMRREVAELIANGQSLTLFGDNLFVDLDLSAGNLPTGTRLRVGEAIVEMSPVPHNGCLKFKGRFGPDALRFVQAKPTRHQNLRGVYWRIVEPGEATVGATIEVLSRPRQGEGT